VFDLRCTNAYTEDVVNSSLRATCMKKAVKKIKVKKVRAQRAPAVMPDEYPFKGSPADLAIQAFGGVRSLSRAINRNASSVCRWRKPLGEGGTGGHVPSLVQSEVLRKSRELGLGLTADDLIPG